jgi:hypothetical protein
MHLSVIWMPFMFRSFFLRSLFWGRHLCVDRYGFRARLQGYEADRHLAIFSPFTQRRQRAKKQDVISLEMGGLLKTTCRTEQAQAGRHQGKQNAN